MGDTLHFAYAPYGMTEGRVNCKAKPCVVEIFKMAKSKILRVGPFLWLSPPEPLARLKAKSKILRMGPFLWLSPRERLTALKSKIKDFASGLY